MSEYVCICVCLFLSPFSYASFCLCKYLNPSCVCRYIILFLEFLPHHWLAFENVYSSNTYEIISILILIWATCVNEHVAQIYIKSRLALSAQNGLISARNCRDICGIRSSIHTLIPLSKQFHTLVLKLHYSVLLDPGSTISKPACCCPPLRFHQNVLQTTKGYILARLYN